MEFKAIILTCEKYHNTRVSAIDNSWGKFVKPLYLSDLTIGDKFIGYPDLPRGYDNIWMKYTKFFKEYEFNDDWYIFADDDTFVNVKKISELITNYKSDSPVCLGIVGCLNKDATDLHGNHTGFPLGTITGDNTNLPIYYPSGGAGFILSKAAANQIKQYLIDLDLGTTPRCYNSDVTMGFWIRNSAVKLDSIAGFWWNNPSDLDHDESTILDSYTYHYVSENLMIELNSKINK